jgi:hypothetical protein
VLRICIVLPIRCTSIKHHFLDDSWNRRDERKLFVDNAKSVQLTFKWNMPLGVQIEHRRLSGDADGIRTSAGIQTDEAIYTSYAGEQNRRYN